jgi:hypothetical protein
MRRWVGLALSLAAAAAAPSFAHAGTPASVVMLSDSGDWVGGGTHRVFHSRNAHITLSGGAGYVTVSVSGGTSGDYYDLDFAAPPGQQLVPAVYVEAQRAPFREAGHAGIDISGSGRGCNTIEGSFEVREISVGAGGAVERLWVIYEQHCEGGGAALFGEVRIGEAAGIGAPLVTPWTVRWPPTDATRPTTVVPVTVAATEQPLGISGVSLGGGDPAQFLIRADECTGRTLAVGGSCQVWLRFTPAVAGTRTATLQLSDTAGGRREVVLQGFAFGGRTRIDMVSDPGDYIGQGRRWSYSIAADGMGFAGSRQYAGFGINGADGSWWYGDFVPAYGDILTLGRYANATRYPFNGTGPGMDVSGEGRGCNTLTGEFTVNALEFWANGRLRSLGLTFEQHCEGATPAFRGTVEFRVGDTTQPAPWMISSAPPPAPPRSPPSPPPPPPPAGAPPAPVAPSRPVARDTKAPNTRIISPSPRRTRSRRMRFRFVSTESASAFQCKLDRRAWTVCRSPKGYRALARGLHVFRVRARDRAGNLDQTPALRRWRIR